MPLLRGESFLGVLSKLALLSVGETTTSLLRSKVPLFRVNSLLVRWLKTSVVRGDAAEVAPLGLGDERPPSSSEAGLLRLPGLSLLKAFLRDMVSIPKLPVFVRCWRWTQLGDTAGMVGGAEVGRWGEVELYEEAPLFREYEVQ